MRGFAIAGAGLALFVGFASGAWAADLPERSWTKAPPLVAPAFNWSGFYAGVNVGGGWYDGGNVTTSSNVISIVGSDNVVRVPVSDSNQAGVTAGGLVGYNYQIDKVVLGVEADFNSADLKSSRSGSTTAVFDVGGFHGRGGGGLRFTTVTGNYDFQSTSKIDWFGTVRGRIGFVPAERLLIYATGGLAYGEVKTNIANSSAFSTGLSRLWLGDSSDVRVGWTAGGGLEYAFTNNWTLRGEYLYVDLGTSGTTATFQGTDPLQSQIRYNTSRDNRFSVARAALSYRF
ncbi:porin family protein [Bradyrhizobium sp. Pear76]|uniref:outer membrane protein n=1 Tax=Bradyrhizobium oropedii TaxID=1571201 RepID=UPI001E5B63EA|nr:outer membrane beta-barrel protein [Bradyrhizobium oropedii]MCC8963093.1 porin family protein [Bradyrhizobium oropedii]